MFHKYITSEKGSAVVGFALAFPLIATIFLSFADLTLTILKRESVSAIVGQSLRDEVRLPVSGDITIQIEEALFARGYRANVHTSVSQRNTASLISAVVKSEDPVFTSRVFGVVEQDYE